MNIAIWVLLGIAALVVHVLVVNVVATLYNPKEMSHHRRDRDLFDFAMLGSAVPPIGIIAVVYWSVVIFLRTIIPKVVSKTIEVQESIGKEKKTATDQLLRPYNGR